MTGPWDVQTRAKAYDAWSVTAPSPVRDALAEVVSEPCRVERSKPKPPTRYPFDCLLCGRHFETRTPRRVFCCDACTVAGKEILRSVDARWTEALVNRGDLETSELIHSVVLPTDVLKIHGTPRCPECCQTMQVVTDDGDYGCSYCYVKVTLL